jgi:hypothetical protein
MTVRRSSPSLFQFVADLALADPVLAGLVFSGAIATVFGLYTDALRTWPQLLLNGFNALSLGLSATFFLAVQRATGARWSAGLRRIAEAFMSALPVISLLVLLVLWGSEPTHSWGQAGRNLRAGAGRALYFEFPLVFIRTVVALAFFNAFAWILRRTSLQQDRYPERNLVLHDRLNRYSILYLPLFAIVFTWTAWDSILWIDPGWFSTIFAIYVFSGLFVQGIAAITLLTVSLRERGFLGNVAGPGQFHDLGKMLFAFSTFWAYIWTCQYLLIWYGNIPQEVTYYLRRTSGPWLALFLLNLIVNWVVPFVVLLSAPAKRNPQVLKWISIVLLAGHWLDVYILFLPGLSAVPRLGPIEILIGAGYLSLTCLLVRYNLGRAPMVPLHDPILLAESPEAARLSAISAELESEA